MEIQYNPRNHQTIVLIVGGTNLDAKQSDLIYYAMSKDINNKNISNLWHISDVKLPHSLQECLCLITKKKVWILQ